MLLLLKGKKDEHFISLYESRRIILQLRRAQCGSQSNFRNVKRK